jgi:hypothetical protein
MWIPSLATEMHAAARDIARGAGVLMAAGADFSRGRWTLAERTADLHPGRAYNFHERAHFSRTSATFQKGVAGIHCSGWQNASRLRSIPALVSDSHAAVRHLQEPASCFRSLYMNKPAATDEWSPAPLHFAIPDLDIARERVTSHRESRVPTRRSRGTTRRA